MTAYTLSFFVYFLWTCNIFSNILQLIVKTLCQAKPPLRSWQAQKVIVAVLGMGETWDFLGLDRCRVSHSFGRLRYLLVIRKLDSSPRKYPCPPPPHGRDLPYVPPPPIWKLQFSFIHWFQFLVTSNPLGFLELLLHIFYYNGFPGSRNEAVVRPLIHHHCCPIPNSAK